MSLPAPSSLPEPSESCAASSDAKPASGAPADIAHPRAIRSFVRRAGRVTTGQAKAYAQWGDQFLVPYTAAPLDFAATFGREAPTVLEIGFGMGEATAHIAGVMPDTNFLCCEVHEPGVGALLKRIGEQGLNNIRICAHDAVEVLDNMLPHGSLNGIHIFFPDPWHKKRHHKRRLIQPAFAELVTNRLVADGRWLLATDWADYAEHMRAVLDVAPGLVNEHQGQAGWAPRPASRPITRFEQRGIDAGRRVFDLSYRRQA